MMNITPVRQDLAAEDTEQVILSRLQTFDEDLKHSVDAREALQGIRQKLAKVAPR